MADVTISPNMNLPIPVVSVCPGPDWATDVVACLNAIDSHNHSSTEGVQISPTGMNINADLPFGSNNATALRSSRYTAQIAPLAGGSDIGCVYVSGADLYYNDTAANQVRITQGGSVTGATGTITGLPSGTASASYAAGTFTFESSTGVPAAMTIGAVAATSLASSGAISGTTITGSGAISGASLATSGAVAATTTVTGTGGLAAGAGQTFKMQRFTGSINASATVSLVSFTTIFGAIGYATAGGGLAKQVIGTETTSGTVTFVGSTTAGTVKIRSNDSSNTNTYDVTVFGI